MRGGSNATKNGTASSDEHTRDLVSPAAFWSAAARRRFLSFSVAESRKKESGVEPPHSKKALLPG